MGTLVSEPAIDRHSTISRLVVDRLMAESGEIGQGIEVRLWNGDCATQPRDAPRSRLLLRHPGALRAMLWPPNAQALGAAYISDDFDVEGEIEPILPLIDRILASRQVGRNRQQLGRLLLALPDISNARQARCRTMATASKYDVERQTGRNALLYRPRFDATFYFNWLGAELSFYPRYGGVLDPLPQSGDLDHDLEQGPDRFFTRLGLQPGETLLDLSAGWGSLVIQTVRHNGVQAIGICQSLDQAELAEQRVRMANLEGRCRFQIGGIDDLLKSIPGGFDKIVDLGLANQIDANQMSNHFEQVRRLLHPGGRYIYQGLTRQMGGTWRGASSFVDSFVLPIGELVPLSTLLEAAEQASLEVQEAASLRELYLQALRAWLGRLEERHSEIEFLVGEPVYRTWRLSLATMAYGLASRQLDVYEAVLCRPGARRRATASPVIRRLHQPQPEPCLSI